MPSALVLPLSSGFPILSPWYTTAHPTSLTNGGESLSRQSNLPLGFIGVPAVYDFRRLSRLEWKSYTMAQSQLFLSLSNLPLFAENNVLLPAAIHMGAKGRGHFDSLLALKPNASILPKVSPTYIGSVLSSGPIAHLPPLPAGSPYLCVLVWVSIYCSSNQMSSVLTSYWKKSREDLSLCSLKVSCCLKMCRTPQVSHLSSVYPETASFLPAFFFSSLLDSALSYIPNSLISSTIVPMAQLGATLKL